MREIPNTVVGFYSKTNQMNQCLKFIYFWNNSTCFGWSFRTSSGVHDCTYSNRHMSETCRVIPKINKFETLVHLVGFTIEIYYNAWPYEHHNCGCVYWYSKFIFSAACVIQFLFFSCSGVEHYDSRSEWHYFPDQETEQQSPTVPHDHYQPVNSLNHYQLGKLKQWCVSSVKIFWFCISLLFMILFHCLHFTFPYMGRKAITWWLSSS